MEKENPVPLVQRTGFSETSGIQCSDYTYDVDRYPLPWATWYGLYGVGVFVPGLRWGTTPSESIS